MPGTIQVAVLDFKNILMSSPPPSSISLSVSMGKRAYQTWDKGDFTFPLTTFRDNLVVRLEDAEGNEISRTEVETLSIVEKGYWDDLFQVGEGYVHMKLQFILTEDDRNRIRNVRESALKKKQDKVPATNVEYSGTAITAQDKIASSMPTEKEFPDAQSMSEMDVPAKKEFVSQKKIVDPSNKPGDKVSQSMLNMDVAAKKESVSRRKIVDQSNKPEDLGAQSMLKVDVTAKKQSVSQNKIFDPSPEDQGVLEKGPSSVRKMISAFETGLAQKKGRRSLRRTQASKSQPNLVGIGGFQIGLDTEDTASPNKMSALRLGRPFNTGNTPELQRNIGKRGESNFPEKDIVGTGQPVFHGQLKQSSALNVPLNEAGSSQQVTLRSVKKESNTGAMSPVDLMRLSNAETAANSERFNLAHSDIRKANILAAAYQDLSDNPSVSVKRNRVIRSETWPEHFGRASNEKPKSIVYHENEQYECENSGVWTLPDNEKLKQSSVYVVPFNEAGSSQQETLRSDKRESNAGTTSPVDLMRLSNVERVTCSKRINVAHSDIVVANSLAADQDCYNNPLVARSETSTEIHFERASTVKPTSIAYCDNEHYDLENSGLWIFPDKGKDLCITTAGKNIAHLLEDYHIGVDDHQRKTRPSIEEITGKRVFFHRSDSLLKKGREKLRKSHSENSNGSSGAVGQVIKIAVIVGFGIFVLLTREKENRRGDRKSKDSFISSPDFMDQLASSAEQWSLLTADGD